MDAAPDSAMGPGDEVHLYQRLLAADPTASYDLADLFLGRLAIWLQEHNPKIDSHLCNEAAEDALLGLFRNPASYNSNLLDLGAFLRMAAQRDLMNIVRRESKHQEGRISWQNVELPREAGKYLGRDEDPALPLQVREEARAQLESVPASVWLGLNDVERRAMQLLLQNERKTAVFATACGLTHLPVDEQKKAVKRLKDRLKKRLDRARESHAHGP